MSIKIPQVLRLATDDLLRTHSKEWQQFWRNFAINIEGDAELVSEITK